MISVYTPHRLVFETEFFRNRETEILDLLQVDNSSTGWW